MIFTYDEHNYFVVIHTELTKKAFLKRVKVTPNTFAEGIFGRMYDCLSSELIDVRKEYNDFYRQEYTHFREYLIRAFALPAEEADRLLALVNSNPKFVLYRKEQYSYGDYSLEQFALSDSMKARIERNLLLQKE